MSLSQPCRTIILIHGDGATRTDLRELLADSGYSVVGEAGDGDSGLRLVKSLKPDVALVEVKLPGKNGIWAAGALHREHVAPVVLMADSAEPALVARAVRSGVYGCVVKPFSARSLVPLLELALERFARAAELRSQANAVRAQIEEHKLLERAKATLNSELGLSESEAILRLQSLAGKSGKSLADVAGAVVIAAQSRT